MYNIRESSEISKESMYLATPCGNIEICANILLKTKNGITQNCNKKSTFCIKDARAQYADLSHNMTSFVLYFDSIEIIDEIL